MNRCDEADGDTQFRNEAIRSRRLLMLALTFLAFYSWYLLPEHPVLRRGERETPRPPVQKQDNPATRIVRELSPVVVEAVRPVKARKREKPEKAGKKATAKRAAAANKPAKPASAPVGKGHKRGSTPSLEGRLDLPFGEYLRHVAELGGRLAVFEQQRGEVIGSLHGGRFIPGGNYRGYSRRARDVTSDIPSPRLRRYLKSVRAKAGAGDYRFLVLVPEHEEQRFLELLKQLLNRKGLDMDGVDRVVYTYQQRGGHVYISVDVVEIKGKIIPIAGLSARWH